MVAQAPAIHLAYLKEWRKERRSLGLCVNCPKPNGSLDERSPFWLCFSCRLKRAEYQRARRLRLAREHTV